MALCKTCGNRISFMDGIEGQCSACYHLSKRGPELSVSAPDDSLPAIPMMMTTESHVNLPISERIDIVTAECAVGMGLLTDLAAAARDLVGGRSAAVQTALRQARKTALSELKREAHDLGANAIIGVSLSYSEISGGGKSMLFLVASGTAVKLA